MSGTKSACANHAYALCERLCLREYLFSEGCVGNELEKLESHQIPSIGATRRHLHTYSFYSICLVDLSATFILKGEATYCHERYTEAVSLGLRIDLDIGERRADANDVCHTYQSPQLTHELLKRANAFLDAVRGF